MKYRIGMVFERHGSYYLLCSVDIEFVNLINIRTGNRWARMVSVTNPDAITPPELNKIMARHRRQFKLIGDIDDYHTAMR